MDRAARAARTARAGNATRTTGKSGAGAVTRAGAATPATDFSTNSNASATATEKLGVDLGDTTGSFEHGADGSLYGLYDQGVPSDNLIQGMGLQTTDTKAQDGQQHPGSDALEIAQPFASSGGRDLYIYMTDVYRNFPYERTSYAQYQDYLRTEVQQDLTSPYRNRIVLVPYNEPDGNWFAGLQDNATTLAGFEAEWQQTYQLIKGLWPSARIAGPNFFQYQGQALTSFLAYCQQNHCLPDIITWHELNNASTIGPDVTAFRAAEAPLGLNLPVSLDEYAARYQLTSPGRMVEWLSAINDAKVGGDLPYWNVNGTLSDSTSQQNIPNAQWWLYHWYSSLGGQAVQVTPPQGSTDNTLQAVASLDRTQRQARIILGGGLAGQADVTVKHVSPAVFGHTVHATVLQDGWTSMTGAAAQPTRVADTDVPVSADGSVSLPVNIAGPSGGTGCDATGPRGAGQAWQRARAVRQQRVRATAVGARQRPARLHHLGLGQPVGQQRLVAGVRLRQWHQRLHVPDPQRGRRPYPLRHHQLGRGRRAADQRHRHAAAEHLVPRGRHRLWPHRHAVRERPGGRDQHHHDRGPGRPRHHDPELPRPVSVPDRPLPERRDRRRRHLLLSAVGQPGCHAGVRPARGGHRRGLQVRRDRRGHCHRLLRERPRRHHRLRPAAAHLDGRLRNHPQPRRRRLGHPADGTSPLSYAAANATLTGTGWNINTEGTPSDLGGFATYADQDVGGLRTGSSTVITFNVSVPHSGDYLMRVFDGSDAQASDVSGPTNVFARVDGGAPFQIWLPEAYNWVIWNYGTARLHLTAGAHTISLSTVGADGAATTGDAIIDKIDLTPQSASGAVIYEAEQAQLDNGARADYTRQGQSGAGAAAIDRGQDVTFWVYSAGDGYSDLAFRSRGAGTAGVSVNGLPLSGGLGAARPGPGWSTQTDRVYLSAGINKVVMAGRGERSPWTSSRSPR